MRYAVSTMICAAVISCRAFTQDSLQSRIDSLEMASLEIGLRMADVEASRTDLFHRLIPRVTFSASFGTHGLLFGEVPVIVPNESYRLTVSFSLDELVNTSRYESAQLSKQKQAIEVMNVALKQKSEHNRRQSRAKALKEQLALLLEELKLQEKIVGFNSMLFDQGAVKFDALARAKLQVISVKQRIGRLLMEIAELSADQDQKGVSSRE